MPGIICVTWVVLILLIWFRTTAIIEYAALLKLRAWFKLDDWEKVEIPGYTYHQFLTDYYDNFFTRLITCHICLTTWLSLIASLFVGIVFFPLIALLSLSLYKLMIKIT